MPANTYPTSTIKPLAWLGGLSAAQFMRRHWQKKPLLVRQAFPAFKPPVSMAQVLALCAKDAAPSRLVRHQPDGNWSLVHGPLKVKDIPSVKTSHWTVLVQQVNTMLPAADRFLDAFRFIPQARLDDLMISVAGPDGGIGAHTDSYDVFLVQATGKRRWEIASDFDPTLVEDVPLKILKRFKPQETWVLEPGDMLYLPPNVAHRGTAVGPGCMTWSVGFRAPNRVELADAAISQHLDRLTDAGWSDPWLESTARPGEIPAKLLAALARSVEQSMPHRQSIEAAVCRVLSEPAPQAVFTAPKRPDGPAAFGAKAAKRGLALAGASRLLYRGSHFFINGEPLDAAPSKSAMAMLRRLADTRRLSPQESARVLAQEPELTTLRAMYLAGWIDYD